MAIDPQKLLPPGRPDTPEGNVDREGTSAGYVTEKQYNSLNKNILAIRRNLSAIADLLVKRGQQDAVEDNQEIDKKRKEIDRTAKGAEENFVESSIKQALIKPVQALGKKIRGPFDGFMKALESLFMGWLGLKGIDALEAWQKGDTEELEKIKNDLIKGLAVAAGVGLALNGGIGLVTGAISGLVTSLLFKLPALIGLMANPWVWLGAAAVYGGIKLLEIIKGMGLSGMGRGGYESYTQMVIDMIAERGKKATKEELQRRKEKLLKEHPWLKWVPGAKEFTPQGSLLLEIEQNIKQIDDGIFDRYDPGKLKQSDKPIINDISAAVGVLSSYQTQLKAIEEEMSKIIGTREYAKLNPQEKARYDELKSQSDSLYNKMINSMKFVKSLTLKMSSEGRDFVEALLGKFGDKDMFNSLIDQPFRIPGLAPFEVRVGDPSPGRLKGKDLGKLKEELDTSIGKPKPQEVSSASPVAASETVAQAMEETKGINTKVNTQIASSVAQPTEPDFSFAFVPYSSKGREALPPVATAAVGTGYPTNFMTQNPYNITNLTFSISTFETA